MTVPVLEFDGLHAGHRHAACYRHQRLGGRTARRRYLRSIATGKTTLMVTIMGLLPHCAGTVRYCGATIAPTAEAMVTSGAVLVSERRALFADMSVEDNSALRFYPRRGAGDRDPRALLCEVFAICPRPEEPHRQGARALSSDKRQMLALGPQL